MQRMISPRYLLLYFGLVLLLPFHSAIAQENSPLSMRVVAGFDGFYKEDHWFPVQIEVSNSGPAIEGEILFESGPTGNKLSYSAPLSLPTQSNKIITLYVNLDSPTNQAIVIQTADGQTVAREPIATLLSVPKDSLLYGVVSSDGGELAYLESIQGNFSTANVAFLSITDLPETAVPWSNLDVLIFNDVDSSQMSSGQLSSLKAWIENGGQFVVTGGNGWEKTATAVSDLLPVTLTGSQTVDDLPDFNRQIPVDFRDPGPYLLTTSRIRSGELLYHNEGVPILASQQLGRGQTYFLAIDPRTAPLLDWDGADTLWSSIINRAPSKPLWQFPLQNSNGAVSAVSSLPSLNLPAVWQLFTFLLIYVLLIGPVNYIILKRRNQLDRAWITIPAIVLIFSLGTYIVGSTIRGNDAIINQISVAFSQAGGEQSQVQTLVGLYAPQRGSYDLSVPNEVAIRPLSSGFSNFNGGGNDEKISLANQTSIENMRLDVGEVATFATQSVQPAIRLDGAAIIESVGENLKLTATLLNNSNMALENGLLLFGNIGLDVGEIRAGGSKEIEQIFTQSMLSRNGFSTSSGSSFNSGNNPLSNHIDIILGSFNYYSDPVLYPRYELIQAIESHNLTQNATTLDSLTFVFWSERQGIEATINRNSSTSSVTLHFVEIPLTTNISAQSAKIIPPSFLEWTVLEATNVFTPEPTNLSFDGNSAVAFEYSPIADFQDLEVNQLLINIEQAGRDQQLPVVALWDWETAVWVELEDAAWGDTAVANFEPYLTPNNTIRIRLIDQSDFGIYINSVYPILSGESP